MRTVDLTMNPVQKITRIRFIGFCGGLALLVGGIFVSKWFFLALLLLELKCGDWLVSFKCLKYGRCVFYRKTFLFGQEYSIWDFWGFCGTWCQALDCLDSNA